MWDDIELLASDDTGSGRLTWQNRQEGGNVLYQMNALAKITSSKKVSSEPTLYACNSDDGCVLVADRTVVVLDAACQSLQMFLQFEAEVDIVGLCQEGQFLVVGERNGNLHLIHVSSKQTLLTKVLVQTSSGNRTYMDLLLKKDSDNGGLYHAFILTSDGFFCLLDLPLAKAHEAIEKRDFAAARKLQEDTSFVSTREYHTAGCLTSAAQSTSKSITLIIGGEGEAAISVWEINPRKKQIAMQNVADSSLIKAAKKLQAVDNLLFVLDKENILTLWDICSLTLIWECSLAPIKEFLLTSESECSTAIGQGIANLKLVALTKSEDTGMENIMVLSLPPMHQLYSLEVTHVSSLVQSAINTDTIYFLEGMFESKKKTLELPVPFLVLRCLTESLPENRLSRLLHKHKFTEAENFALQFGLEVELVYKVKISSILERLASESPENGGQSAWLKLVPQAKETLDKIKDDLFVIDYCINTPWPTLESAQEMLNYARHRLLKNSGVAMTPFSVGDPTFFSEVLGTQAKLTTFSGAFESEKFSGAAWLEFLNNRDVFRVVLSQLKMGNLTSAQYIWLRHQADFERGFNMEMLDGLLSATPVAVSLEELCLWFKEAVLPFIRRVLPKGQKQVAKWLEQGARNLELTDKANWPENGLKLAEIFFTSKDPGEVEFASTWDWISLKDNEAEEICSLMKLVRNLQGLTDLFRKYDCRLPLCDFEKENANTIVFRMFDKVLAAELIPVTLEKYIEPYLVYHNLPKDEILLQYIKDFLERHCKRPTSVFDTTWEAKAIAVLGCISNIDLIIEGVLAIMHSAGVPWSPQVEQLVQKYLAVDHAKAELLQEGYKLMEMKALLRSYRIRDTKLLNNNQMIMMLVKYILKQDTPPSVEDALKIVNTYKLLASDVYVWRTVDLIEKEKGEEVLDLLRSLNPVEAVEVAEKILIWGRLTLEAGGERSEEESQWKMQLLVKKILVGVLNCLISHQKENFLKKEEYEADSKLFKTLAVLQENFGICLSAKDYGDPTVIPELIEECINSYRRTKACRRKSDGISLEGGSKKIPLTLPRLHRLGSLLGVPEHVLVSQLVLSTLEAGRVEEALGICRDFCEVLPNEHTGHLLFLTSQKLCHMLSSDSLMVVPNRVDLPALIHEMASQAATFCSPDLVLDALELCKWTWFAHDIYAKGQMEDFGFLAKTTSFGADKDPYEEWMFGNIFVEDGAVLDAPTLLPLAYEIASFMVPVAEKPSYPLDAVSLPYCPFKQGMILCLGCKTPISSLLNSLQEFSQFELTLNLILSSGALLQHMIAGSMDASLGKKKTQDVKKILLGMVETSSSAMKSIATALLQKIFSSRHVDHHLALAYCTLLPKEVIFKRLWDIINGPSQNYGKILAVALVGTQLAARYEEKREWQAFEELIADAEWGIQLDKLGISFQHLFRMPSVRKKELLATLVQHPSVKTDLLLKYCNSFRLDADAVLQLYTETTYIEGESLGKPRKNFAASIAARAAEVIPLLQNPSSLITNLCTTLYKLDPYDYESIESLLRIIEKADGIVTGFSINWALVLIKHLKSYTRTSAPGELETQYAFEQTIPLSAAAQTRLPFHLIFFRTSQCFWKIISPELSEESFPKLLLIARLMKVSLDTFHMYAAMHVFKDKLKPRILELMSKGRLLISDKEAVKSMQSIQAYLLSIVNLEWATAIAHKMVQDLPTGPSKVQALKLCCNLAEKWLRNTTETGGCPQEVQSRLKKLQLQHQKSATEAALMAHHMDSEAHQKLIGKPAHLIILLYQHRSISERIWNPTGRDYPDIHALVKEIAEINNLDMKKIWDTLLEKWLCPEVAPTERISELFENIQEDEDLKRVLYLLQLYPVDQSLRILYICATSTSSPIGVNQLTFNHRRRALQCLLLLADRSRLESLFKTPTEEIKRYQKCLAFLAELEILKIPYTFESFRSAPKEGMIKGLWKNHSHEPRAVKLVTELSLEYKVHDPLLWNSLLQKLIGLNVTRYLRKVLIEITGIYSLWQIPNFSRAWQSVVLALATPGSHSARPHAPEACLESFKTLLRCPVLPDLDLMRISKQYVLLEFPALALACLVLIPDLEKRTEQIQALLASCQLDVVLTQAEKHMSVGEVALFGTQIREQIWDYFINEKSAEFETAKYFPLLKSGQVDPQRVKDLVEKLVDKNRTDEATALRGAYLKSGNLLPPDDSGKTHFNEPI